MELKLSDVVFPERRVCCPRDERVIASHISRDSEALGTDDNVHRETHPLIAYGRRPGSDAHHDFLAYVVDVFDWRDSHPRLVCAGRRKVT